MREIPEYRNVKSKVEALLDAVETAKNHDEYKDNPEIQRAFAIAKTNIDQAWLWMDKGFRTM